MIVIVKRQKRYTKAPVYRGGKTKEGLSEASMEAIAQARLADRDDCVNYHACLGIAASSKRPVPVCKPGCDRFSVASKNPWA